MSDPKAPKAPSYPLVYQAQVIERIKFILVPMALLMLGLLGRAHMLQDRTTKGHLMFLAVIAISFAYGWNNMSLRATLSADSVELKTWFGRKTIRRADIGQIRLKRRKRTGIVIKGDNGVRFYLPPGIERHPVWAAWSKNIPVKQT